MNRYLSLVVASFIFSLSPLAQAAPKKASDAVLWVVRDDGTKSCEGTPDRSLELAKAELEKSGIKVLDAKRGHDGLMHIQMCGASTGDQNQFQIRKADLKRAAALGFKEPGLPATGSNSKPKKARASSGAH